MIPRPIRFVLGLAIALAPLPALAEPGSDLTAARDAFRARDYETCSAKADAARAAGGRATIEGATLDVAAVAAALKAGCEAIWGDTAESIAGLNKGIASGLWPAMTADWLWARALAKMVSLDNEGALADIDRAIKDYGPSPDRLVLRCVINNAREARKDAEADARAALAIDPDDAAADLCLAAALPEKGGKKEARALRKTADKLMEADDARYERAATFRLVEY